MFERISRGFELALASWRVVWQDKKLVLFPVLSALVGILVCITFLVPTAYLAGMGGLLDQNGHVYWWGYLLLFAFYFASYFVVVFFNAALIFSARMSFRGEQPTLVGGLAAAGERLPAILAWALVSATVGVLLKFIESLHEQVGAIVSRVLGMGWTVLTYFVVPILVVENVGPVEAAKRSVALLRKAWGEGLVGNAGLGMFTFLISLPGFLIVLGGAYLIAGTTLPWTVGVTVVVLGVLVVLIASAFASALSTVFQAALYDYAASQEVPAGFNRAALELAFRPRKPAPAAA